MAYDIGYVDNTGSEGLAHWQMLAKIKALAEANGWTTLRYLTPSDGSNRELILKGVGLSGDREIYIGFRTYHDIGADYYNLSSACFTGYVDANPFTSQPGYIERGVCGHNLRIDYWLSANAQRIFFGLKIGSPAVYEVAHAGQYNPYATPGQYPYPMACIGMLPSGTPATRHSDTSSTHTCGVKGQSKGYLRDVMGNWVQFTCLPWTGRPTLRRDTGGYYSARKAVLMSGAANNPGGTGNVWGELDGIRYISGFNNGSENTVSIDDVTHVVLGDAFRNGIGDYFLLEMS